MGDLGGDASHAESCALAITYTRLLQALPHLGSNGKTSRSHLASLRALGAAKWFGNWR